MKTKKKPIDGKLTVIKPARRRSQEPEEHPIISAVKACGQVIDGLGKLSKAVGKLRGKKTSGR